MAGFNPMDKGCCSGHHGSNGGRMGSHCIRSCAAADVQGPMETGSEESLEVWALQSPSYCGSSAGSQQWQCKVCSDGGGSGSRGSLVFGGSRSWGRAGPVAMGMEAAGDEKRDGQRVFIGFEWIQVSMDRLTPSQDAEGTGRPLCKDLNKVMGDGLGTRGLEKNEHGAPLQNWGCGKLQTG